MRLDWRQSNPDKIREYNPRMNPELSMTVEEFDSKLAKQKGVCQICARPETRIGSGGNPKRLSIDYDHETGKLRDLLCDDCNNMLGRAHDRPERLRIAAAYLERWSSK